jgi:hypothetical protein
MIQKLELSPGWILMQKILALVFFMLVMQITMAPESLMPGFKISWNKDRHQSLAYTLARS